MRRLVDDGFKSGDPAKLDRAVLVLIGVVVLLAGSTFCRFYLVSWIGERVVADIRRAVFDRLIALSPAYFEVHRTGDILSRLTTEHARTAQAARLPEQPRLGVHAAA